MSVAHTREFGGIRSIERAMMVLKCFSSERHELSLAQICEILDLPKTTIFRILVTLEKGNLVELDTNTGKYRLSYETIRLGNAALETIDVGGMGGIIMPYLKELMELTQNSAQFYVRDKDQRVCIAQVKGLYYSDKISSVGVTFPLGCTPAGRIMMAYMEESEVEHYLETHQLTAYTSSTITDSAALRESFQDIFYNGYAIGMNERIQGAGSIGAPAFDAKDQLAGVVSVSGLTVEFTPEHAKLCCKAVINTANKISTRLGARKQLRVPADL